MGNEGMVKAAVVIHAVGPDLRSHRPTPRKPDPEERFQLQQANWNALRAADEMGCVSVVRNESSLKTEGIWTFLQALPFLSAGIYGCDIDASMKAALHAALTFVPTNVSLF